MRNSIFDQLLLSTINNNGELYSTPYAYMSIFLTSIEPDVTNARFLPVILIEDEDAKLFVGRKLSKKELVNKYQAENRVLIGKSCVVNCLDYGSDDWKRASKTLEKVIELGNNISVSELIQVPTLYPIEDNRYGVLTGHRRFFALVYANGYGSAAQFKVYDSKPLLIKVKQFQENASREDLPQYGKLQAFKNAMVEMDTLNSAKLKIGQKRLTVKEIAANLGISMGTFDNYNVLTRYSKVISAYEAGLGISFVRTKKVVLSIESKFKEKHQKSQLNIEDKNEINQKIEHELLGNKEISQIEKPFKIKPIKSVSTIKTLLETNIMSLDMGIHWDDIDWSNRLAVSNAIEKVIEILESGK
jgi:hypothetical protein